MWKNGSFADGNLILKCANCYSCCCCCNRTPEIGVESEKFGIGKRGPQENRLVQNCSWSSSVKITKCNMAWVEMEMAQARQILGDFNHN